MRVRLVVMLAGCLSLGGCVEYRLSKDVVDDDDDTDDDAVAYTLPLGSEADGSDDGSAGGSDDGSDDGSDGGGDGCGDGGGGGGSSDNGGGGSSDGGGGGADSGDADPEPGASSDNPREPEAGELVISELMIDPEATSDRLGEWVELYNGGSHWVDLSGHRLADDGVDDHAIQPTGAGSLVVGPGGFLVICASDDRWDNGGVDCQGTVPYETWGGGFALSNSEDEVVLLSPTGVTLDRFAYDADFAYVGASMGVDPEHATVSENDDTDAWCDQWSFLSGGDYGNPGESNDWCW